MIRGGGSRAELSPARRRALDALVAARERDAFIRDVFARSSETACPDRRDEALAMRLAFGVTAAAGCLDDALDAHIDRPRDVSPALRDSLRISAFEIIYLRTAPEIAVSQGVELARAVARGAAGLANAVLRRVAGSRGDFLDAADVASEHRGVVARARRAGLPTWLVRDVVASIGDRADSLLDCQLDIPPVYIQVGAARPDIESVLGLARATATPLPGCYRVESVRELVHAGSFERAELASSDYAAQLVASAAVQDGSVLEVGAGRGTKCYVRGALAARLGVRIDQTAVDLFEWKCSSCAERMSRAGFAVPRTFALDARDLERGLAAAGAMPGQGFDCVLLDAPCSGTGTMRRHLEIPWRLTTAEVRTDLPALQLALLKSASRVVAVGGDLLYATCSVLSSENDGVVDAFLASEEGSLFAPVPVSGAKAFGLRGMDAARADLARNEDERGRFQTVPARDGGYDGHFCARFVRIR